MIDRNVLEAKNINFRDKVKRKPRKHSEISPLSTAKVGHFYSDYLKYIEENDVCVTEMDCVVATLDMIEFSLGAEMFSQVFPLILTDNGSEFADIKSMETSCITGGQLTKVFFCEPNRSDEKGSFWKECL